MLPTPIAVYVGEEIKEEKYFTFWRVTFPRQN
jgi:hypothetical protein